MGWTFAALLFHTVAVVAVTNQRSAASHQLQLSAEADAEDTAMWRSECNSRLATGFTSLFTKNVKAKASDCVLCVAPPAVGTHKTWNRNTKKFVGCRYEVYSNGKAACRMRDLDVTYTTPGLTNDDNMHVLHDSCCRYSRSRRTLVSCETHEHEADGLRRQALDLFDGHHIQLTQTLVEVERALPSPLLPLEATQRLEDTVMLSASTAATLLGAGPAQLAKALSLGSEASNTLSHLSLGATGLVGALPSGVSGFLGLIVDGVAMRRASTFGELLDVVLDELAALAAVFYRLQPDVRATAVPGSKHIHSTLVPFVRTALRKYFSVAAFDLRACIFASKCRHCMCFSVDLGEDAEFKALWEIWARARAKVCSTLFDGSLCRRVCYPAAALAPDQAPTGVRQQIGDHSTCFVVTAGWQDENAHRRFVSCRFRHCCLLHHWTRFPARCHRHFPHRRRTGRRSQCLLSVRASSHSVPNHAHVQLTLMILFVAVASKTSPIQRPRRSIPVSAELPGCSAQSDS